MTTSSSLQGDELALLQAAGEPTRAADAVLTTDRHEMLKHDLLENLTDNGTAVRRRRLAVRVGAPVALTAAAAAAVVFFAGSSAPTPAGRGDVGTTRSAIPRVALAPAHIATVAYRLDRGPGEAVTITIHDFGDHAPDADALRQDLARMGVPAQVTHRIPDCSPKIFTLAQRTADGDYVATIYPRLIDRFPETVVFSLDPNKPDPGTLTISVGTPPGAEPTCAPLPGGGG
jgi:hypothetical protein